MQNFYLKYVTGCALAIAVNLAYAGGLVDIPDDYRKVRESGKITHLVEVDNDTLLLNREDGFYSSGMRYVQVSTMRDGAGITAFGWRVGQELFTASDIKLPPALVGPPDHPYAGWLYGGFFKDVHRADGSHTKIGIDLGCLGPCAGGEWTQTKFHKLLNQPLPRAWSRQVRNEPGVVLYAEVAPVQWKPLTSLDVTPGISGRFGNIFTDIGANMVVRAGQLNVLPGEPTFHAYLRADVRAVGYNATLQGGYFSDNDPHTVDPKRWIGEAEAGVVWRRGPYGINAGLVRRGNEIRGLPASVGAQNFLRLQFSYTP